VKQQSLFGKERLIYWPEEFSELVDQLNGRTADGKSLGHGLYGFNTGAIVLAAALGVQQGRRRDVGPQRKEISTSTFASHRLELYIFLIPLLGDGNLTVDVLRPESEDVIVREFERYAAGGLEFLAGVLEDAAGKSIDMVVQSLASSLSRAETPETELPDLLA
jgi:dnd system-associated protein 4